MAAGNFTLYANAKELLLKAGLNLATGKFQVVLCTSSYTPAPNSDSTYANISADETTGAGYTAGGQALSGMAVTLSVGTAEFDATSVSWTGATITAKYAIIVNMAGTSLASTDVLLGYVDLNAGGGSLSVGGGTFSVDWNASGIFTLA